MRLPTARLVPTLACLLLACDVLSPVKSVDLCTKNPPSADCAKCRELPRDPSCPQCTGRKPAAGCPNAAGTGMSGLNGSTGGSGSAGHSSEAGRGASGNSGGTGGESDAGRALDAGMVDAGACGTCPAAMPLCVNSGCAECANDGDCKAEDRPRCDPSSHACVGCIDKSDCASGSCDPQSFSCVECETSGDCTNETKPACDVVNHVCVECTKKTQCTTSEKPWCEGNSHTCVECLGNSDCGGTKHVCDMDKHACVECLGNSDCASTQNPQCDLAAGACQPCTSDEACTGRTAATVCDTAGGATQGQCVECTGSEYDACKQGATQYVCDSLQRTCSSDPKHRAGMTGVCAPCISDAECMPGMECVHMQFGSPAKDVGWFCLWQENASGVSGAPNGDCSNARPFVAQAVPPTGGDPIVSIDGQTAAVCTLRISTCLAFEDFSSKSCTQGIDSDCGFTYSSTPSEEQMNQDAYCVQFTQASYRCTLRCFLPLNGQPPTNEDCPPPFTCNAGGYCNLTN